MTYSEFIEQCKTKEPQLHEKHHIIPLCVGGTDDESNLIKLSFEDHWTAHKLLAEENPDNKKIVNTFAGMGSQDSYVKKAAYKQSDAFKSNLRERMKDEKIHQKLVETSTGRVHSEETKQKISNALKNHYTSPDTRELLAQQKRGKHFPKISEANRGKVRTEEMKKRYSEAAKLAWERRKQKAG